MDIERLVKMVNDISRFYQSEPDHEEAVRGVLGHIRRFWDPRMRRELAAHVASGGAGLTTLGLEAARQLPAADPAAQA